MAAAPRLSALAGILASLTSILVIPQISQADFSSVGVGVSVFSPTGNIYQTIGRATGVQADATYNSGFLGPSWQLHAAANYRAHKVRNISDASVYFVGVFAGINTTRRNQGIAPYFGFDVGGVYDSLNLSGSSTTQNHAVNFAARIVPGVDLPVWGKLGAALEFPTELVFTKTPLVSWNGVFALRWHL